MIFFQAIDVLAEALCFVFWLYKWVTIVAIFLTWVTPDPHNPIVYWINRITHPLWEWCYQRLPRSLKLFNAYAALLVVIFLHALVPATLQSANLALQGMIAPPTMLIQVAGHALQGLGIVIYSVLWFAIIILAVWFILTLVSPSMNNPIVRVVYTLADPLITPIQGYLPRMQVDLSPLIGIFIFFLISKFFISPIFIYGATLSAPVGICAF